MLQLYKNIKNRRIELGMTQAELANKIGYADKSMIAKIEKGDVDLTQSKILALSKALNISQPELFGWDEKDNEKNAFMLADIISDNDLSYYLQKLFSISESGRAKVFGYIDCVYKEETGD